MNIFKKIYPLYLRDRLEKKHKISVTVKHYTSGTYSFSVQKHNGDASGWTRLSRFMEKGCRTYYEALKIGIDEGFKYAKI